MFMIVRPTKAKLKSQGMERTTSQTVPTSYTKQTGMSIKSGYPNTAIINDGLVMNAAGLVNIVGYITHSSESNAKSVAVYKNGVLLQASPAQTYTSNTTLTITNNSVVSGDRFELYALSEVFSTSINSCYLTIDLAA